MIKTIKINNFKSIKNLSLDLGCVTVFIGENGSGKSNILEAITYLSGALSNKLDSSFISARGARVSDFPWVYPAFPTDTTEAKANLESEKISFEVQCDDSTKIACSISAVLRKDDNSFEKWETNIPVQTLKEEALQAINDPAIKLKTRELIERIKKIDQTLFPVEDEGYIEAEFTRFFMDRNKIEKSSLLEYAIYAPENTTLRTPPPESALQPLGTKGEGLLKLLQSFSDPKFQERLIEIKKQLNLLGWFEDFVVPDSQSASEAKLQIRDRWLSSDKALFDQRSANEGFLYLLFYFTLIASWRTPSFFAIDNIDNALNPKLCSSLMSRIVDLSVKYKKQIICTTHNPAILDGLDLNNDNQRLYVVRRDSEGRTVVRRIPAPQPQKNEPPVRLSEAFTRGLIGGLPKHF